MSGTVPNSSDPSPFDSPLNQTPPAPAGAGPRPGPTPPPAEAKPWRPELQMGGGTGFGAAAPDGGAGDGLSEDTDFAQHDLQMASGPSRLKASLSRANLVLFGLFLLGVGVVAFMSMRKGPQATNAAEQRNEQNAHEAIDRFLQSPGAAAKAHRTEKSADQLVNDTKALVQTFYEYTGKNQVPLEDLKTNPFKFHSDQPDLDPQKTLAQNKVAAAAEEAARKKRQDKAKADFAKLRLQTVMNGPAGRQAMINSSIVKLGDLIDEFKVEAIEARKVTLSCEGATYELEITY